jgi:hypothetical protein
MVIDALYDKYFQKSKVFMYPLLDIKRGTSVIPTETYVSWNKINPEDAKLVCVYSIRQDEEYKLFTKNVLLKHSRLYDFIVIDSNTAVYIFDFSDIISDWNLFIKGKYSQISENVKRKILGFFEKNSGNYVYVKGFLYPETHFADYARILDVDIELLKSVGELCDIPNLEKETLFAEVANLENIEIIK